ncbi:MAG: ankyrin repeat domain-containing protein [Chloroflexota bacterium]|nr:ankyrin repeat domain-containing protein [Chloroflexota bacterium]
MTALMKAVEAGDAARVKALIAAGESVNVANASGDYPLVMAAYLGHSAIVGMLLDAGADLTVTDPGMKATALHAASYAGRHDAAALLVRAGIAVDQQGPYNGYTALHDAIWQNNIDVARMLIEAGADLTIRNNEGQTPLAFAQAKRHHEIAAIIEAKTRG